MNEHAEIARHFTNDDAAEWVREAYNVPAEVGRRVVFSDYGGDRKDHPGIITSIPDGRLRVRLDGCRASLLLHPTWKLRYLNKVTEVPELHVGPFTPTGSELDEIYYGVPVAQFEDGGGIAITGDRRKALAALNRFSRECSGMINLEDSYGVTIGDAMKRLRTGWAVFEWQSEGADLDWIANDANEGDEHAVAVTWLVV